MLLTKEAILKAKDIKTETVAVPEWGGDVIVKGITAKERDEFEQSLIDSKQKIELSNARAKLCTKAIVDNKGERLFTDADIIALGKKSAKAIDRVYEVASRLGGISDKDVKELVKNSEKTHSDDSPSN